MIGYSSPTRVGSRSAPGSMTRVGNSYSGGGQMQSDLTTCVTDQVGYTMAGALFGFLIVSALNKHTPLKTPWWVGLAAGAAAGAAANWHKENI